MDMNRAFFMRKEDAKPRWRVIDAKGKVVGRLATQIANMLRGKDKPVFTPHTDTGDYVVVINADKLVLTGDKMEQKTYEHYTGWIGNKKSFTAKQIMQKDPAKIIELAVKRMMPRNIISKTIINKLRIYTGSDHPHKAQISGFGEK